MQRTPAKAVPSSAGESAARTLYVTAADPEGAVPGTGLCDDLRAEMRRFEGLDGPGDANGAQPWHSGTGRSRDLDDLQRAVRSWAETAEQRHLLLYEEADTGTRQVLARRAALGCAPLALVSGAWLQWLTGPANADSGVALRILALYASDVGVGRPRGSRGDAYLTVLRRLSLSEHAVPAERLANDPRVADAAFHVPAVLLAMSRRPDVFDAEILGADLCLRAAGRPPALGVVRRAVPDADWDALDPGAARHEDGPRDLDRCRAAVAALLAESTADRVLQGFGWAFAALRWWDGALFEELTASCDPAHEMAELLRLRAREGAVYHRDFRLDGRSLSDWLAECRDDPGPLLSALAASRLIKRGRSADSPLVNGLVGERGRMFRVFSPDDLTVIRRWIDALPRPETAGTAGGVPAGTANGASAGTAGGSPRGNGATGAEPLVLRTPHATEDDSGGRAPETLRAAYHRLQTRAGDPALARYAFGYVHGWLARSRHGIGHGDLPLPERWTPDGLRPWLVEQHDEHGLRFEQNTGAPVPSRRELIDSTVQLAPLTLIDGGWLQGFTDYGHASSEVGHFLFETYWDELGNGEPRLNHPLIYREVLAEMGVRLPPTGSEEFARWPGFEDRSFELPVYWLCIGRFPRTFLPEVLGLNLAMELSGVGGTYRQARIALKSHGFSTRFVDIHNTIDNVASGHSAWAADAVDTYMAGLPALEGPGARTAAWERVRTGYRSLNPPSGRRARRAARRARTKGRSHA
ncbi:iron-containing redox enzyme family protein [Actinomadura graeca]|uniref:Iron-containing redox enzyme family protein n=1 Tax=Actinomadura graeca TaxID=2750812 RepID=A0ABX8QVS2_9ACTN|nr:iron-containing redox enzyme family protein [Actinomadura graeca]QXJ22466.1 iron-containing redox enzyme family protein [Actinomadura graeca]